MRQYIPWHTKIALKLILARLPVNYAAWSGLSIFKHGDMADASYSREVFDHHVTRAARYGIAPDGVYLELGPGDSVAAAVLAAARGAERCYLVDVDAFATRDMTVYRRLADSLRAESDRLPLLPAELTFEELLALLNASYLTDGLRSLQSLSSGSVDLIWSQATLEHVRRNEFAETIGETFRILRPGGIASHRIDLRDHLGGALNNLRFGDGLWEKEWMARSGFYTNRLRCSEILKIFEGCGFVVEELHTERYERLPTPRERMAPQFRKMSDSDLLIHDIDVVLRKPDERS